MRPTNSVLKGSLCATSAPCQHQTKHHVWATSCRMRMTIKELPGIIGRGCASPSCSIFCSCHEDPGHRWKGRLNALYALGAVYRQTNTCGTCKCRKRCEGRRWHTSALSSLAGSQSFSPSSICTFACAEHSHQPAAFRIQRASKQHCYEALPTRLDENHGAPLIALQPDLQIVCKGTAQGQQNTAKVQNRQ